LYVGRPKQQDDLLIYGAAALLPCNKALAFPVASTEIYLPTGSQLT
jgi:hypothetical protein